VKGITDSLSHLLSQMPNDQTLINSLKSCSKKICANRGKKLLQILAVLSVAAVTADQSSAVLWRWEMCLRFTVEKDSLALQTFL